MSQILLLTSSPRGAASHSTQIARALAAKLEAIQPGAKLVSHDFAANPLPHITEDYVVGRMLPAGERSAAQAEAVALSDKLIAELKASDTIVIGSGMINFGVPSTLKAWIDYIARAGETFAYGANGPSGLVTGKKVYLVEARGGIYSEGPFAPYNFQEPYLKTVLGFLGMTDVETILVEGVARGAEIVEKNLAAARAKIDALAA